MVAAFLFGLTGGGADAVSPVSILYVDASAIGANDGSSWDNAFTKLHDAVAAATSGTEIWVATGVYYPDEGVGTTDNARSSSFTLVNGVGVYGGFDPHSGAGTWSTRDPDVRLTILSGNITQNDTVDAHGVVLDWADIVGNDNAYHVVIVPADATIVLDGFTITGGAGDESDPSDTNGWGGGLYSSVGSRLTLNKLVFRGNKSFSQDPPLSSRQLGGGGAMFNRSTQALTNVSFIGNCSCQGAGAYSLVGSSTYTDVVFENNDAWGRVGGCIGLAKSGGGLTVTDPGVVLERVQFKGNSATQGGGGLLASSPTTLRNVTFDGNSGGGLADEGCSSLTDVTFTNNTGGAGGGALAQCNAAAGSYVRVTFTGNHAGDGGALWYHATPGQHPLDLVDALFAGNEASSRGGAIYVQYGIDDSLRLINAVIRGNRANNPDDGGGAIFGLYGCATLINSTVTGNSSRGALWWFGTGGTCHWKLKNSIVWGNAGVAVNGGDYGTTFSYSLLQGWPGGTPDIPCAYWATCDHSLFTSDPLFVTPVSSSGPATTVGDVHLQPGSPAIDAGSDGHVPADTYDLDADGNTTEPLPLDLDGNPRFSGSPATVDIGAYEYRVLEPRPDLTISKSHVGDFVQGQLGATYTLTVRNLGTASTNGTLEVTDTLPAGLFATGIIGIGWSCTLSPLTCTRADPLPPGESFPEITVTVDVAWDAEASLTNVASVAGGDDDGAANNSASDPTTVLPAGVPLVVISQIFGGGSGTNAIYRSDFIELYNRGTIPVSLTGWSLQYASASGTGNFGASASLITPLYGTLHPGQYLLVEEFQGGIGAPLPTPDVTDPSPILMATTSGKVALVNTTVPLGCNGSSTPCSDAALATIVDLVGYGVTANFHEGPGPAPTPGNLTADLRKNGGCVDTNDNAADFIARTPNPRNSGNIYLCTNASSPSGVGSATPATVAAGRTTVLKVVVTPGADPTSTALQVTANLIAIGGPTRWGLRDDGTGGDETAGDNTFSSEVTVHASTAAGSVTLPVLITDAQGRTAHASIDLAVFEPITLTLSPETLPAGTVGTLYFETLSASGGVEPYSFSLIAGSLPPSLYLDPFSGKLSGTPTASGSFDFTVQALDSSPSPGPYTGSRAYTLVIAADTTAPTVTILRLSGGGGADETGPDFALSTNSDATLRWRAGEAGMWELKLGGTGCADASSFSPAIGGTYAIADEAVDSVVPIASLTEGVAATVWVCVTDSAGNTGGASAHVTRDTVAPAAPVVDLPDAFDTGSSATDNVTGLSPVDLTVDAESGSNVRLYAGDSTGTLLAEHAAAEPLTFSGVALTAGSNAFAATATDAAGNTSAEGSLVVVLDAAAPASTLTFPAHGGTYADATWKQGCGTPGTADLCGTATDTGASGLAKVELSIKRNSDATYWNGTAFSGTTERWNAATGTSSWAYPFAPDSAGAYTVRVRAADVAGNVESSGPTATFAFVVPAATQLLYTGQQIVVSGSSLSPVRAALTSNTSACIAGQTIHFTVEPSPTGAASLALGSATTNASGVATLPPVTTVGWAEGVYTLRASFDGTTSCLASQDEATLTVATPGSAASGGGYYVLTSSNNPDGGARGRVNFGFTVKKTDPDCVADCEYKGQLLVINNGKWRVKGRLLSFATTGTAPVFGASDGVGDVFQWDATANAGLGAWVSYASEAGFTISFTDGGVASGKSANPDAFGIQVKLGVPSTVTPLPNSPPVQLKGGNISIKGVRESEGGGTKPPRPPRK